MIGHVQIKWKPFNENPIFSIIRINHKSIQKGDFFWFSFEI